MAGCEIRIFGDGFAYVDFDSGERVEVDLPKQTLKNNFYNLDYLDDEKNVLRTVTGDTEEEMLKYMCDMIHLIDGPGMYYYDLNKVTLDNADGTLGKLTNVFYYSSNPEFNKNEHAEHFSSEDPYEGDEETSDTEVEEFEELCIQKMKNLTNLQNQHN